MPIPFVIAFIVLSSAMAYGQRVTDLIVDRTAIFRGTVDMGQANFQFPRVTLNPAGACTGSQIVFALQSSSIYACNSGTWTQVSSSGGGGGGGTDIGLAPVITTTTVATIAAGITRVGHLSYSHVATTFTITVGGGITGTAVVFATTTGVIRAEVPSGMTVVCSPAPCEVGTAAVPAFAYGQTPIASYAITAGVWTTVVDKRAAMSAYPVIAGSGLAFSDAGGSRTLSASGLLQTHLTPVTSMDFTAPAYRQDQNGSAVFSTTASAVYAPLMLAPGVFLTSASLLLDVATEATGSVALQAAIGCVPPGTQIRLGTFGSDVAATSGATAYMLPRLVSWTLTLGSACTAPSRPVVRITHTIPTGLVAIRDLAWSGLL